VWRSTYSKDDMMMDEETLSYPFQQEDKQPINTTTTTARQIFFGDQVDCLLVGVF
jgi:hypothetical protein